MDMITDLPPVDGCDSILVMIDRGNTKGAILISTTKTLMQKGASQLLFTDDVAYPTKCCLIKDHNLLQKHFENY
jgi:hypothetical protein